MRYYFSGGDDGKLKMAAITHPIFLDGPNRATMLDILRCWRGGKSSYSDELLFPKHKVGMGPDSILELQSFLLDRDRAGGCYVNGETYSKLALRIWDHLNPTA
jgi:hypothetical protein